MANLSVAAAVNCHEHLRTVSMFFGDTHPVVRKANIKAVVAVSSFLLMRRC